MALTKIESSNISATGTADGTTFLRGDMAWAAAGGGFDRVTYITAPDATDLVCIVS